MQPTEKDLDQLLAAPQLRPPADFARQVMRRVYDLPSPFPATASANAPRAVSAASRRAPWRRWLQALSKRRIGILSLPQLLAFVFGIMLATAAG